MRHDWDAKAYDSLTLPHVEWGRAVVERLGLRGDEHVLEAGAGTGRDALLVLDRIPNGRYTAVDGSMDMLALLRERLAPCGDRVATVEADLLEPLHIETPADAVFSVATFHWVTDHDLLFANLAGVMRSGGRLVFDCGGEGNVAELMTAIAQVRGERMCEMTFRGVEQTRASLAGAGFAVEDVRLRRQPVGFADRESLRFYVDKVGLGREAQDMSASERAQFAQAVVDLIPGASIEYVRIEAEAVKR